MNVLVTGGAGFIGSHVVQHCLDLGHKVTILDNFSGGSEKFIPDQATLVKGSVVNAQLVRDLFRNGQFEYVYHLAAFTAEGLSHFVRRLNYSNNLIGSANIINESINHNIKCFVFTSSIAVYGSQSVPMKEEMLPLPEDPYGISKYAIELDLQSAHKTFGMNFIIFRPHNVYGPYQNLVDRYRNVIGIFMRQGLLGEPMTIFGDGSQTRAFSYIDDIAPYIAKSVHIPEAYNEVYNIGDDRPHEIKHVASQISNVLDTKENFVFLPERFEVKHAYASQRKAHDMFNIEALTELEDGLARMADWAKESSLRLNESSINIEVNKNIPSSWMTS